MPKVMIFIDGTWLYCNTPRLAESYGQQEFRVDFGKLPRVIADALSEQVGAPVDLVRTYLFGSYATNCDPLDEEAVRRRRDFFEMLKEEYHYEVETYPINFAGRRLRRTDRSPDDPFEPKEKCVDIALATCIMFHAAIPYAYDIALTVLGDEDFKPVLQSVRHLGKRVAIASIRGSCAPSLSDPRDEARVKDFDIIWLNDLMDKLELKYERHLLRCESPIHKGEREVWTTFHPRKGQKFFCDACRKEFSTQREPFEPWAAGAEPTREAATKIPEPPAEETMIGVVKRKIADRGFGFIEVQDGRNYFFHLTDLAGGWSFEDVAEGEEVEFSVKREPGNGKAGAAQNVRPRGARKPASSSEDDISSHEGADEIPDAAEEMK